MKKRLSTLIKVLSGQITIQIASQKIASIMTIQHKNILLSHLTDKHKSMKMRLLQL